MLENWGEKIEKHWVDLQAGIEEIKTAALHWFEEQHRVFRMQKRIVNSFEGDSSIVVQVSMAEIYTLLKRF